MSWGAFLASVCAGIVMPQAPPAPEDASLGLQTIVPPILGVTSPEDLRMALPYWGETLRFEHVLRHEMAHQFHIQKAIDRGRATHTCNPVALMPLWFTEGLAEAMSQPELTADVRAAIAD